MSNAAETALSTPPLIPSATRFFCSTAPPFKIEPHYTAAFPRKAPEPKPSDNSRRSNEVAVIGFVFIPPTDAIGNLAGLQQALHSPIARTINTSKMPLIGNPSIIEEIDKLTILPTPYDVLLIGDSVSVRAVPYFQKTFPGGQIDSAVSRQLTAGELVYDGYKVAGLVGKTVVFSLGTNGLVTEAHLDSLITDVGFRKDIYLINTRSPNDWEGETNAALANAAARHGNVTLIDWYALSADHDSYFDGDGTHLTEEGAQVYIDMIEQAIHLG